MLEKETVKKMCFRKRFLISLGEHCQLAVRLVCSVREGDPGAERQAGAVTSPKRVQLLPEQGEQDRSGSSKLVHPTDQ